MSVFDEAEALLDKCNRTIDAALRSAAMDIAAEAIKANPQMKDEYLRRLAAYQPRRQDS